MCLARRRREEHLRQSKVSWGKDQRLLSGHKHGLLHFPCFPRKRASPAGPPASIQAGPLGLTQSPGVSCRQLFWARYILTCLPVCTTVGCPDCRGMGSETPCRRHTKRRSFPLRNDFFFSSPTALSMKIKSPQLSTLKEITSIGCNTRCACDPDPSSGQLVFLSLKLLSK